MRVVVIAKNPFATYTYTNVVSITISGENYVINDGSTHTYPMNSYKIQIV